VLADIGTSIYYVPGILPPLAVDRLHRHVTDDTTVLHLFTSKVLAVRT
jgi:hypothetical protein